MTTERTEQITALDGETYDAWLFAPDSGTGPGLLLFQEIFGVSSWIRAKAADLVAEGYVVLCPDVFWRSERRVAHEHDEAGLGAAFVSMTKWSETVDDSTVAADNLAALAHLRSLPEVEGRCGALGYCLGGNLAYVLAVAGDPDAAVSYYGSKVADYLDRAVDVHCPMLFHYGGSDPYIPAEHAEAVKAAFAGRDDVEVHVYDDAGHAFENSEAPMFFNEAAAARSWATTLDFLARTLKG